MQMSETVELASCPTVDELRSFDRGFLPDAEIERVSAHLESGCSRCVDALDRLEKDDEFGVALRSATAPVSASLSVAASQYRIVSEIGRGGMGVVYHAIDTQSGRAVALKQLTGDLARNPLGVARFQQEVKALARIEHPHVVRLYDSDLNCDPPYLVMELVDGKSLSKRLSGRPLAPAEAAGLIEKVAGAVHAVHTAGLLHRDLKPGNILLTRGGEPKVSDFGLARPVGDSEARLTRTGALLGTPEYMPPEQAQGEWAALTPATDVYALGATLYEMLTGRPPFRGPTALSVLDQVIRAEPLAPTNLQPSIPNDLQTICLKCLEKLPKARYESAADLAADLCRWRSGQPILARPTGRIERAFKWSRRNPSVAGLLATVALLLLAGSTISSVFAVLASRRANDAKLSEEKAILKADDERKAREEAERNSYNLTIRDADREWLEGRADKAMALLETCPESMREWEWHYLVRRCRENETLLVGISSGMSTMQIVPDGSRVRFYHFPDGTVQEAKLIDSASIAPPLSVSDPGPRSVVFDRNARFCAVNHADSRSISVWDLDARCKVSTLICPFATGHVVAFSSDGLFLAAGNTEALEVLIWETRTGKVVLETTVENENDAIASGKKYARINSLAFSRNGRRLAVGTRDRATILEIPGGDRPRQFVNGYASFGSGELLGISNVAFVGANDSQLITAGLIDIRVKTRAELLLHDLQNLTPPRLLANDLHIYEPFAVSQNGGRIAHTISKYVVAVRDSVTGREIARSRLAGRCQDLHFTQDASSLLIGTNRGLEKWRIDEVAEGEVYGTHGGDPVFGLALAEQGDILAYTSHGSPGKPREICVSIWDRKRRQQLAVLPFGVDGLSPSDLAFSRDESLLAAALPKGQGIQVWDWRNKEKKAWLIGVAVGVNINRVRFTSNGNVIGCTFDGQLLEWSLDNPDHPRLLYRHPDDIADFELFPDGSSVALGGGEKLRGLRHVQLPNGELLQEVNTSSGSTSSIALRPNSSQIAVSCLPPSSLELCDLQSGARIAKTMEPHNGLVPFTLFTSNGRRIITGSHDCSVKVWDAERLTELLVLRGHTAAVNRGVVLPNGMLFTSSWDGTVRMWDGRLGR